MAYNPNAVGPAKVASARKMQNSELERPDFGASSAIGTGAMTLAPAAAREVARIQGKLISAKTYPRDPSLALIKIESECGRRAVAENATLLASVENSHYESVRNSHYESVENNHFQSEENSQFQSKKKTRTYSPRLKAVFPRCVI